MELVRATACSAWLLRFAHPSVGPCSCVQASVDIESDNLIQQVIATHFQHATVIAIAHRLSTIADFDRILVMDDGRVAEFGVPHLLLQDPASALSSLVDATGPASAAHLRSIAKQSHENVLAGRPAHVEGAKTMEADNAHPVEEPRVDAPYERSQSYVRFHVEDDDGA